VGGLLLLLAIGLGSASAAHAQSGWYLMTDIESGEGTSVREVLISGGKIKSLPQADDDLWTLIDLNSGEITFVDPAQGVFARATPADHCAALEESGDELRTLVPYRFKDDESLPAEARDTGSAEEASSRDIRIREIATNSEFGGFESVRYDVRLGRDKVEEVYLTTDARLLREVGGLEGVAAYVDLIHELNQCSRAVLGEQAGPLPPAGRTRLEEMPEYLETLEKGWPVKTVWLDEPSRRDETVTIASEWDVEPADLEPPAGYRAVSITQLLLSSRR
jgi:hypothetical protein